MVEPRRDEGEFVKVLDFGIAKIQDSTGEGEQALTRQGFVCRHPGVHVARAGQKPQVDHRLDLYADRVLLYQMVTGLLPFDSESAVGFATAHLTQEVPPIRNAGRQPRCSTPVRDDRCRPGQQSQGSAPERQNFRAISSLVPGGASDDIQTALSGLPPFPSPTRCPPAPPRARISGGTPRRVASEQTPAPSAIRARRHRRLPTIWRPPTITTRRTCLQPGPAHRGRCHQRAPYRGRSHSICMTEGGLQAPGSRGPRPQPEAHTQQPPGGDATDGGVRRRSELPLTSMALEPDSARGRLRCPV